ncbi:MAG: addiction module protein [Thermoleophilia bacterium]
MTEAEVEALWLGEAKRRRQEIAAGAADTLSMEEALSTARAARR